jgi:hypothetical protein
VIVREVIVRTLLRGERASDTVLLSWPDALVQLDFPLRFHLHLGAHPRIPCHALPEAERRILITFVELLGGEPLFRCNLTLPALLYTLARAASDRVTKLQAILL